MDKYDLIDVAHLIADRVQGKGWETGKGYHTFNIQSSGWNLGGMVLHFDEDHPKLSISISVT